MCQRKKSYIIYMRIRTQKYILYSNLIKNLVNKPNSEKTCIRHDKGKANISKRDNYICNSKSISLYLKFFSAPRTTQLNIFQCGREREAYLSGFLINLLAMYTKSDVCW